MKQRYVFSLLLVVIVATLILTACPRPKSTTVSAGCTRNASGQLICDGRVTIVYRPTQSSFDAESMLIVDIPAGWESDLSNGIIEFETNSDTANSEIFELPLSLTASPVGPIDSSSTVFTLAPNTVSVASALQHQSSESESTVTKGFSFSQSNCQISPGEYTFHFRKATLDGVAYIGGFTVLYQVENEGSCDGSSIIIKE